MNNRKLHLMQKVSYACCPGISLEILVQFALDMCVAGQKIHLKNPYFTVQGHPRSLLSVAIELVINSNLGPISHSF